MDNSEKRTVIDLKREDVMQNEVKKVIEVNPCTETYQQEPY